MLLAHEPPMEECYDRLITRLAVESNVVSNVLELFGRIVPKSSELIKSFLPNLHDQTSPKASSLSNKVHRDVMLAVSKYSFLAYEKTLVTVPEGFKGDLVAYLEVLLVGNKLIVKQAVDTVTRYNLELSQFLSNADVRSSLKSHALLYKDVRKERESHEAAVKIFFDPKNPTNSRVYLGDIMGRFVDMDRAFVLAEQLDVVKRQQNYKDLISQTQKASDMLDLIKKRVDANDIVTVSGATAKNLSEGAYEVAKYVEIVAMYGYFVDTALGSVNNIAEQMKELFIR